MSFADDLTYLRGNLSTSSPGLAITVKRIADSLSDEKARNEISSILPLVCAALAREGPLTFKTQLLRVLGNACFDHADNRKVCVDNLAHTAIVDVMKERVAKHEAAALEEAIHLRAAAGAILNLIIDSDIAQAAVLSTDFIATALTLIDPLPSPLLPLYAINSRSSSEKDAELIQISATVVHWLLKALQELHHSTAQAALVEKQALSFKPLANLFLQVSKSRADKPTQAEPSLANLDCEILLLAAELLEAFLLDVDVARQELGVASIILPLLDFIQDQSMPASWLNDTSLQSDWAHIQSAISKSLTAIATEDTVMDACFEKKTLNGTDSDFQRMDQVIPVLESWLKERKRDDLLICASVMLANLARTDQHCLTLVQDYDIVTPLSDILRSYSAEAGASSSLKIQVLHGVTSLLKNLAIPSSNKSLLNECKLAEPLVNLLKPSYDLMQPVQVAAIGLIKNLATNNVENSIDFLDISDTLRDLIALTGRKDDLRLRMECIRVLVVLVRSVWTIPTTKGASDSAKQKLCSESQVYTLLAGMIASSSKYPVLINEGVVSVTRLAAVTQRSAEEVVKALLVPLSAPPVSASSSPKQAHASLPPLSDLTISEPPMRPTIASFLSQSLSNTPKLLPEIQLNILSLFELLLGYKSLDQRADLLTQIKSGLQVVQGEGANPQIQEKAKRLLS